MPEPALVLRHSGRELHVQLDDDAIVFSDPTGAAPRRLPLASIRAVRLARIGTLHICALSLDDGKEQTIATDEAVCRPAFATAVRGLYDRLAPGGVPFIGGSWLVAAIVIVSCVAVGTLGLLLYLGVLDLPAFRRRGIVLAIVTAVLGPVGAWTARPRPIRDLADLAKHLPR